MPRFGGMEAQTALKGPMALNAETAVHLHIAFVVHPRHPENHGSFRLDDPLVDIGFHKFGMLFDRRLQRLHHFFHCLVKFRLIRVRPLYFLNYVSDD